MTRMMINLYANKKSDPGYAWGGQSCPCDQDHQDKDDEDADDDYFHNFKHDNKDPDLGCGGATNPSGQRRQRLGRWRRLWKLFRQLLAAFYLFIVVPCCCCCLFFCVGVILFQLLLVWLLLLMLLYSCCPIVNSVVIIGPLYSFELFLGTEEEEEDLASISANSK